MSSKIKFAIDRGGTFTDVYAETDKGFFVEKLLSDDPSNYADAPREGIRRLLSKINNCNYPEIFSSESIEWIRMGTTVATNALLERKGARCALVTTKGFKDILKIGNQSRDKIFDLIIRKYELLYEEVLEVDERIRYLQSNDCFNSSDIVEGVTGDKFLVLKKPEKTVIYKDLKRIYDKGIRSVAIILMHGYTYSEHETIIGQIAEKIGFTQISLSHKIIPMVKITARGDTTTVDAYLTPHIKKYLESFRRGFSDLLENTNLLFMQSDGGLTSAGKFNGSNAILSGPAGGVVGYAKTCYEYFEAPVIGFDMGGTSTDVSRYGGNFELVHETTTAGVKIQAPQLNINTVAAGGGSRLFIKNGLLVVGPESSGAHPGPVCYRKGGFLSITDANLVLGRLQPEFFPKIFGSKGNEPLDREASIKEFQKLLHEVKDAYNRDFTVEEIALGFIKVANAEMIRAIKEISVMRGYDVKEHILSCFGGAGGQHACSIARQLGIKKVFIHRFSGILSAYGMGLADVVCERQEPASCVYSAETLKELTRRLDSLEKIAASELMSQGYEKKSILSVRYLNLRFKGTDTAIMIAEPNDKDYKKSFHREYIREFGFDFQNRAILVDDIRVRAISKSSISVNIKVPERKAKVKLLPKASFKCYFEQGFQETGVYFADDLLHNDQIQGPAIIIQDTSTILVEPGCSAVVSEYGDIILNIEPGINEKISKEVDPVQLSIFSNLFMSIAEQMGRTLQKTAISTNIKERLDFSCAIFDKDGDLVANAPHIPVHLGAMGEAVKSIIGIVGKDIKEGDVLVTNHPKYGGSHLPDITVITPVWSRNKIVFYVANRGHHADIGGISPGSMPPFSTSLYQEGVCIKCFKLVENGLFKERQIKEILLKPTLFNGTIISGSRNVSDNISDLKAQVAANQKGIDLLI